jgi:hypothetical protein
MKKPVIVALCCLLALGTATAAFAEEPTPTPAPELVELSPEDTAPPFYPDSISWQEDGGQLLVVKQYSVPYGTAVADLTESGMQWGGFDYTLWGVTQSVEGGVTEEKEVTQDFELSVRSADAETARNDVKESVAYDDEYGFSGSLTLQDITIGETLQADSTYMATAHYAGTVTRTEAGTVHYTLLYAPVSAPVVVAAVESRITPALLIMGIACALLFIAVLLIIIHLLHKEPAHAGSTEPLLPERPKSRKPANSSPTKTRIMTSRSKSGLAVSQNRLNFSLTAAPPQHHLPATAGGAGGHSDGRSARPNCPGHQQRYEC